MSWFNYNIFFIDFICVSILAISVCFIGIYQSNEDTKEINLLYKTIYDLNKTIQQQTQIIEYCKESPLYELNKVTINSRQKGNNCVGTSHDMVNYLSDINIESNLVGGWWDTNNNLYKLVEDPESGDDKTSMSTALAGEDSPHEWVKATIFIEATTGNIIYNNQIARDVNE